MFRRNSSILYLSLHANEVLNTLKSKKTLAFLKGKRIITMNYNHDYLPKASSTKLSNWAKFSIINFSNYSRFGKFRQKNEMIRFYRKVKTCLKELCDLIENLKGNTKQSIWLNASNDCQGKICRHKCRCEYRFTHTYDEIHVYRQITNVWDGGTDYYTGCNLKKYIKKQSIQRRFTAHRSKMNVRGRSASVLDAVKKFKQKYSA